MNSDFLEKGYFVVSDVLSEQQCRCLEQELPATGNAGTRLLLNSVPFSDLASKLAVMPEFGIALQGLSAIQCTLFDKSSVKNWSVRRHRDSVIPVRGSGPWPPAGLKEGLKSSVAPFDFLSRCVAVRVALDCCEDGDLEVVPGSHLEESDTNEGAEVPRVPRLGALVLRPTLLHGSKKLTRSTSRRVLHYLFAPSTPPHNYKWYHKNP